jgi:hypothetical protein
VVICSQNNTNRTSGALASEFGPQVAASQQVPKSSRGLVILANVLILAREEVVAALLGLMVELHGLEPQFLTEDQAVADALEHDRQVVLIDCDHPACAAETIELIRKSGGEPVLFSPFRFETEVTDLATRHQAKWFTLPINPENFDRLLRS